MGTTSQLILNNITAAMKVFVSFLFLAVAKAHHEEIATALEAEHETLKNAESKAEQRAESGGSVYTPAIQFLPYPIQYQQPYPIPIHYGPQYRAATPITYRAVPQMTLARQLQGSAGINLGPLGSAQLGAGFGSQGLGGGFSGNILGLGGSVGGGLTQNGLGVGVNAGFAQQSAPNYYQQYNPYYTTAPVTYTTAPVAAYPASYSYY